MKRNKIVLILLVTFALGLGLVSLTSAQANVQTVQYVVQPGDTLSKIAANFCTTWQEVYYYNAGTIGSNPDNIEPGMVLYVPNRCTDPGGGSGIYDRGPTLGANGTVVGNVYYVAAGDNLFRVAQRFGVRLDVLMEVNGIDDPNKIDAGQAIIIPGLSATPPTQPPIHGISTKDFVPNECVLTPLAGAPSYSYPNGPVDGQFGSGGSWSAIKGVRLPNGEYWYMIDTEPGSGNPPTWVRDRDTALTGNCRW